VNLIDPGCTLVLG